MAATTIGYTKNELRTIYASLSRLRPPGSRPLTPEELVTLDALMTKTSTLIAAAAVSYERGAKVLEWRIPNVHAPTLNAYAFLEHWRRKNLRKLLDDSLHATIEAQRATTPRGNATKRWLRVTRFTPTPEQVDGTAPDEIGGKMPIDALVRLKMLIDDRPEYCHREGVIMRTKRGNTHVLVELFEIAAEEVADPGPRDAPVVQPAKKGKKGTEMGPMTAAIVKGTAPK